jgi:hypothetical protein
MLLLATLFQPITPRTFFTTVLLKDMAKETTSKTKLALFAYIGTHHYYLWSPIERRVIVLMAALGISFSEFFSYALVPLAVYAAFLGVFIAYFIRDSDFKPVTEVTVPSMSLSKKLDFFGLIALILLCAFNLVPSLKFGFVALSNFVLVSVGYTCYLIGKHRPSLKQIHEGINWKIVAISSCAIVLGWVIATYAAPIVEFFSHLLKTSSLLVALGLGLLISFILGHGGKDTGVTIILTSIFGVRYFPIIYILDLCGFMVSPANHTLIFVQQYLEANFIRYYATICALCLLLIVSTGLLVWY